MVSAWALPVMVKASVWPLSVMVTPAAAPAAEIASTPWIDALVAPSVLRSAEVEVRLIVSPVPAPRLIVPAPMRMASSWAPLSVTVSVPDVPVRLPVSTLVTVGVASAEMLPLATTFSTSVPAPRLIVLNAANCAAVIVTVSLPLLPVSVSMPETVPSEKSTVVACCQHDLVAGAAAAVGPALDRLAGDELAVGDVDRVVARCRRSMVSAPVPPVMVSAWALPVMAKASVWPLSVMVTPAAAPAAEIASTPWIDALVAAQRVEVGRGRGQVDRVAGAGAEIDRAGADEDGVELGAAERHRIGAGGAGEVAGLDIGDRRRGERRDVAAGHDVEHVRADAEIDRAEARQLRRGHRHSVVAGAAGQRLDAGDRAEREVDRGGVRQHDLVARAAAAVGAALDRLAGDELAVGDVDRVVAAARDDGVGTGAAGDGVGLGAAGDGEGFGLAAQRDGHAGCSAGGRDRLDALDRCVGRAQRVEVGRGRGQVDRVAGAGAEIDRAGADEDGVELGAAERHRIGAGVPVRLPVSTLVIVGMASAEMLPLATTLSTSVPPPRLIVLNPANCAAVIVTVSLPLLPVSVSMPATVPSEKSTVVPLRQHDLVARAAAAVGAALDRLAGDELAVGDVDRVVATAGDDRVGAGAAGERVTDAVLKLGYRASGESGQRSRRRVGDIVAVAAGERGHHAGIGGHAFGRERRAALRQRHGRAPIFRLALPRRRGRSRSQHERPFFRQAYR